MNGGRDAGTTAGDSLAGRRAWLITDAKVGMDVQVCGLAHALGLDYELKHVKPRGMWRLLAPWGPVDPSERLGSAGSSFKPPWPDIILATGRSAIPYIRGLVRLAGPRTFSVVLQDPKTGPKTADLIWVPEHDTRRGPNVITTLTAPHSFTPQRLAALRQDMPADIAALPAPRVTLVLGGPNAVYKYTLEDCARLGQALRAMATLGVSFLVTPSRRTPPELLSAVKDALQGVPSLIWEGKGENPYPAFLAHADIVIVTADSVNMTGEACATGRPVYVFTPAGGSKKFDRFHSALRNYGATRPLPAALAGLENWDYEPLDSAALIAAEIERRWLKRRQMLPGIFADQHLSRDTSGRGQA